MLNSDVFFMFYLLARGYTARGSRYIRGKLIGIHRDWMKLLNSDVFCFGDIWRFEAIHRKRPILAHPDVFFTWYWTFVHRDGHRILNPDVSPTETRVSVHRDGPKSGISDVCSKNHTFRIHRDAPRTSDSDVSKKRIHRNSSKTGNPDVSNTQKYPKSIQIHQF